MAKMAVDIEKPKNFPCEKCEKSYGRKDHLNRHTKIVHEDIKGVKKYTCEKCTKQFCTKESLKKHMKIIHDGMKNFKCQKCGKTYSEKFQMKLHTEIVHHGIKKFKCEMCNRSFSHKCNLKTHVKLSSKNSGICYSVSKLVVQISVKPFSFSTPKLQNKFSLEFFNGLNSKVYLKNYIPRGFKWH